MKKISLLFFMLSLGLTTINAQPNCEDLLEAIKLDDKERVAILLKSVDPDCAYRKSDPRTPLIMAARNGREGHCIAIARSRCRCIVPS